MLIAVKARAKNGLIQRFLDEKGWTQARLAAEMGIDQVTMGKYINFQQIPQKQKTIDAFERVVRMPIEEIFPESLKSEHRQKLSQTQTQYYQITDDMLEYSDIKMIEETTAEDIVQEFEKIQGLGRLVGRLPDRMREVIDLRYGLSQGNPMTLRAIGETMGITTERVRQIETQAMRRLRHNQKREDLE